MPISENTIFRHVPAAHWAKRYSRIKLSGDLTAAGIVTVMLIPQSLAYALIAGMPPQYGLYASILPLLVYALLGTSATLAVGPVAIISLLTAATVGRVSTETGTSYLIVASVLAAMSGMILIFMGLLKLGFLVNFISRPVQSAFTTASGIIIAAGQLGPLFGFSSSGQSLPAIGLSIWASLDQFNLVTAAVGIVSLLALVGLRMAIPPVLGRAGVRADRIVIVGRAVPLLVVIAAGMAAFAFSLGARGVPLVGHIPSGLPALSITLPSVELMFALALPAFILALIAYVSSIAVAQTLALKRRERVDANQELLALGACNIASSVSGGFPVTGGFARSIVNFEAGAVTPAAGAFTALGIAVATLLAAPMLEVLPKATLAATILVAVTAFLDFSLLKRNAASTWPDFIVVTATVAICVLFNLEVGILLGVAGSIAVHLVRTSRPHAAVIGLVPGTQHFRNVLRHSVETHPQILSLRIDESLYFANARFLEDWVLGQAQNRPSTTHVILSCSSVNAVDLSAIESLERLNGDLQVLHIHLHLSEVKGPVMDFLMQAQFLPKLSGQVFLSHYEAYRQLSASRS